MSLCAILGVKSWFPQLLPFVVVFGGKASGMDIVLLGGAPTGLRCLFVLNMTTTRVFELENLVK